jgi:hypothetical protein
MTIALVRYPDEGYVILTKDKYDACKQQDADNR